MTEPRWLSEAKKYLGQREVPGAASNPWIKAMWLKLKGGTWFWKTYGEDDSKLPWCGGFMGYVMQECGLPLPKNVAAAKSWLEWGVQIATPVVGCVVVFTREGGGHVGLVVGKDQNDRLMVLGANQGDAVSIAPFDMARVSGYRWPDPGPIQLAALPVVSSSAPSSRNEA